MANGAFQKTPFLNTQFKMGNAVTSGVSDAVVLQQTCVKAHAGEEEGPKQLLSNH